MSFLLGGEAINSISLSGDTTNSRIALDFSRSLDWGQRSQC